MNVKWNGRVVGEIALTGMPFKCPYPGNHGYLPYGFIPTGKRKPSVVVCDQHCHEGGYWQGLLAKVKVK